MGELQRLGCIDIETQKCVENFKTTLPALSRPWPHGPNAAARPVKAVVRASRSIFKMWGGVQTATAKASAGHALFSLLGSIEFRSMHKGVHLSWLETQQAHRAKGALWACG